MNEVPSEAGGEMESPETSTTIRGVYTDNLCIEKVSHYWLTLLVICMATYMPNFGLVRVVITD